MLWSISILIRALCWGETESQYNYFLNFYFPEDWGCWTLFLYLITIWISSSFEFYSFPQLLNEWLVSYCLSFKFFSVFQILLYSQVCWWKTFYKYGIICELKCPCWAGLCQSFVCHSKFNFIFSSYFILFYFMWINTELLKPPLFQCMHRYKLLTTLQIGQQADQNGNILITNLKLNGVHEIIGLERNCWSHFMSEHPCPCSVFNLLILFLLLTQKYL